MRNFKFLAIALLIAISVSSCIVVPKRISQHKTEVGHLNTVTAMKDFDGISVAGAMNVVLVQGNGPSVQVKGDNKETFDQLVIYVEDNTLIIDSKDNAKFFGFMGSNSFDDITVYVTMPSIKAIELAGSGNITASEAINADDVDVEIAGSGNIEFKGSFSCNRLSVSVAGSGDATFNKIKANKITTSIAGSGNVAYYNMGVTNVDSEIAGSGNIILDGKVAHHTENIIGSGNVDTSHLLTADS